MMAFEASAFIGESLRSLMNMVSLLCLYYRSVPACKGYHGNIAKQEALHCNHKISICLRKEELTRFEERVRHS